MPDAGSTVRRRRGVTRQGQAQSGSENANSANRGDNANGAQQQPPSPREAFRQLVMRSVLMYAFYYYYVKKPSQDTASDEPGQVSTAAPQKVSQLAAMLGAQGKVPSYYSLQLGNAWPTGISVDFRVFSSLNPDMNFREAHKLGESGATWSANGLEFATVPESYLEKNVTLQVPEAVRIHNSTWYAHIFVGESSVWEATDPSEMQIDRGVLYYRHEFIKWLDVDLRKKEKNLLGGENDKEVNENAVEDSVEIGEEATARNSGEKDDGSSDDDVDIRYDQVWKPTMPIVTVPYKGMVILGQLPTNAAAEFRVDVDRKAFYPPMHVHEFWMLRESHQPMNSTVHEVTVEMSFSPMGLHKWSLYKQFDSMWQKQIDFGTMAPHEKDDLKRIFIDTNPWLLGLTTVVSTAHTVLETLAFKNDISHWRSIKSMEGVSVRSMIWKIVMEAIIFLYLWDNETSWMITIGNGVGLAIAIWKLGKAVKFENLGKRKLLGFIPWFDMVDRESYSKETKEYDEKAMKYLSYALYPLVGLYALYTLKYEKHKSWYSWVISSLVGAVYAFGFLMMLPQVFINYKLKSVAHMPMKAMMYKTLNTVIDDLFSFIIKMPWLHRLACFRDDVVFLIILYQRWIYPVDAKRVNEFGQKFDEDRNEIVSDAPKEAEVGKEKDGTKESDSSTESEECKAKSKVEKKND